MKTEITEKKRTSKSEAKLGMILKAASECFARYGYEKTTLDDIGKIARLNKASLYYYFKNKEEIFFQVVLAEARIYLEGLQAKTADYQKGEDKIIFYLIERMRYYRQVLNIHQLSIATVQQIQPEFDKLYHMVLSKEIEFIQSILDSAIQKKEFKTSDSGMIAESLVIIADAIKHDCTLNSNALRPEEIDFTQAEERIKLIVSLIINGLKK